MKLEIRRARLRMDLSQKDLAEKLGVSAPTLNGYESGKHEPKPEIIVKIAEICGVTADFLLGIESNATLREDEEEGIQIGNRFTRLDSHGQDMVRMVVEEEMRRMESEKRNYRPNLVEVDYPRTKSIPMFGESFAAGPGVSGFEIPWERYEVPQDCNADFALKVSGDSMEPYFRDGSVALGVQRMPNTGEVAAILIDGENYIKQYCQDNYGNLYLFSLNRKRKAQDITVKASGERFVKIWGTVLSEQTLPPLPDEIGG